MLDVDTKIRHYEEARRTAKTGYILFAAIIAVTVICAIIQIGAM